MKGLKDVKIKNRKVILRASLNVPLDLETGRILDGTRLEASIFSMKYILKQKPKMLLVVSHLGRPEGKRVSELSLSLLVEPLEKLLDRRVIFVEGFERLEAIRRAGVFDNEAVYLFENLRFWSGEESNEKGFARELAGGFSVFINDSFSVSHRQHASLVRIPEIIKEKAMGLLFQEEYDNLSVVRNRPKKPAVAIIGGAKVKTKLPVIKNLLKKYDKILVGGKVANEILDKKIKFSEKVLLPDDFAPVDRAEERLDIGPVTVLNFKEEINKAKSVVWNGPVGKFEEEDSAGGTKELVRTLAELEGFVLIGGGETIEAVKKFGSLEDFDYVSKSGGAMLEFLAGKKLPGIEALK